MQRKLTAILSADVVGYTGLMEVDETGTLERLKANRSKIFDPHVTNHGGRVFKLMGDGALVEFSSVVAAGVACEEQALRERPNVFTALRFLAACHVRLGQMEKARSAIAEVLGLVPNSSIKSDAYGQVAYTRASDREYAAALRKAGLPEE
jgi:class 3 adenylate cyclase